MKIALVLNGRNTEWEALPGATLLAVLRGEGLTAAKRGCETGDCGACTVLLDGQPVNSCVVAPARAHGRQVTTLEGLAGDPLLKRLQEALVEHAGIQCGYCTAGMVMSLTFLHGQPDKTDAADAAHQMCGNLCRCTGYGGLRRTLARLFEN